MKQVALVNSFLRSINATLLKMETLQEMYGIPAPGDLRLLFVDDEAVARKMVPRILKEAGYSNVTTTSTSREALQLLESEVFHVLICDLMMPDVDGIELLARIRANEDLANLTIIVLSAVEDLSIVYQCLEKGADDYITKPIQRASVQNLWSNVLRKKKEKHVLEQLADEQSKRKQLDEQLSSMRDRMKDMDTQMVKAVETPISVIMDTVKTLQSTDGLTSNVKGALSTIMQSLRSSNLYKPAFQKYFASEHMDPVASRWVLDQLSLPAQAEHPVKVTGVDYAPVSESLPGLRGFDWDVWKHSEEELQLAARIMLTDFDLVETFNIDQQKLVAFIAEVRRNYLTNPYHNFRHAIDVMQSVYSFLTTGEAAKLFGRVEIFALLIAALGHDLGHGGLNNQFLVATEDPIALRYNDQSVLENYHCALLFSLLSKPELNILEGLKKEDMIALRRQVIKCVLATDMSRHMEIMNRLLAIDGAYDETDPEQRLLLMNLLIKSADIANPTLPFSAAKYWAEMLREEIFIQGDKERELGLKVSMFMDRQDKATPLAKMQTGFADVVLLPLYRCLNSFVPKTAPLTERLLRNRETWGSLV